MSESLPISVFGLTHQPASPPGMSEIEGSSRPMLVAATSTGLKIDGSSFSGIS
jgi:hypothetical protein